MASRSNPNTPSSQKPRAASALKSKRRKSQRQALSKITKPTPRTSQAIRKTAPLSRKKARKLDKKNGHAKKRAMEEVGEVEMKDVDGTRAEKTNMKKDTAFGAEAEMDVDDGE
ncbi:hypothetical protein ACLMJK_007923 [Lecanora helva]